MTEEEFEQELRFYQQAIVEAVARIDPRFNWNDEVPELSARFKTLAKNDRTRFLQLVARLLEDERREVQLGILKLIGLLKTKDNVLSLVLINIAIKQKDLREEALLALWPVRTHRVLPQLLLFADKGYSNALYMIRRMLQTPEEIEQGVAIARKYIAADDYELREAALFLLQGYSIMEREAEGVLEAIQKYTDELFISALKYVPPERVLEPLKMVRSRFPERSAEYEDLSSTIQVLEQKKREMDEKEREN